MTSDDSVVLRCGYPFQPAGLLAFFVVVVRTVAPPGSIFRAVCDWALLPAAGAAFVRCAMVRVELDATSVLVANFWRTHRVPVETIRGVTAGRVFLPDRTAFWWGAAAVRLGDARRLDLSATHGYGAGWNLDPTSGTIRRHEALHTWATAHSIPFEVSVEELIAVRR